MQPAAGYLDPDRHGTFHKMISGNDRFWYDCVNGEKTDKDYHSAIWIPVKKKD